MSILKVEVGSPVTIHVKDVEDVEGQFGPQLKFVATNGDCLFVSRDAGQRQLERIGVTEAAGMSLTFEKVQKGAKTYLNINPAKQNGNGGGTVQGGKSPLNAPQPPVVTRAQVSDALDLENPAFDLFKQATAFYCAEIMPILAAAGVTITHEGTQAGIATLVINASQGR